MAIFVNKSAIDLNSTLDVGVKAKAYRTLRPIFAVLCFRVILVNQALYLTLSAVLFALLIM